ncbi:hypothetical protein D0C36_15380 [Mucilaginibacter conchicola]|uniref:Uncharacterized protein n=1 Tax=Mucilaginibacter conchicola TaxID=2303333 RepID=A0A372NVX5_9SPHI|nr:hypothetical protein D0C36_15380 [Mucilaginibacter conchicola]
MYTNYLKKTYTVTLVVAVLLVITILGSIVISPKILHVLNLISMLLTFIAAWYWIRSLKYGLNFKIGLCLFIIVCEFNVEVMLMLEKYNPSWMY